MSDPEGLAALTAAQSGLATVAQLRALGFSGPALRLRARREWRPHAQARRGCLAAWPDHRLLAGPGDGRLGAGGRRRARAMVIEAVQRRLVAVQHLRHELVAGPNTGARALARALEEAERGAWSVPEADLARLVASSSLLAPMLANPVLHAGGVRLPTPDGWFDDVGLAVQVHSRRYHAGELDWEAAASSDGVFAEHGVPVVGLTPRQIAIDGSAVLRRLERAHAALRDRPRPAGVATARASSA